MRVLTQSFSDRHYEPIQELVEELGLESDGELPAHAGTNPRVRDALHAFRSRESRGTLLAKIAVLNSAAFADLLRFRLSAPFAYTRLQVESLSLCYLMSESPEIASEWQDISTEADGRAFFQTHQHAVRSAARDFGLHDAYERASSFAMHSRFLGIAFGLDVKHEVAGGKFHQAIQIKAQEFDPDDPGLFVVMTLSVLQAQARILGALPRALPEIDDPIFVEQRVPRVGATVESLLRELAAQRRARGSGA
ncbi:MAG: hypothetical protein AAF430_22065 [Myxococcota bacterium]